LTVKKKEDANATIQKEKKKHQDNNNDDDDDDDDDDGSTHVSFLSRMKDLLNPKRITLDAIQILWELWLGGKGGAVTVEQSNLAYRSMTTGLLFDSFYLRGDNKHYLKKALVLVEEGFHVPLMLKLMLDILGKCVKEKKNHFDGAMIATHNNNSSNNNNNNGGGGSKEKEVTKTAISVPAHTRLNLATRYKKVHPFLSRLYSII
jgi:hypothetical protein